LLVRRPYGKGTHHETIKGVTKSVLGASCRPQLKGQEANLLARNTKGKQNLEAGNGQKKSLGAALGDPLHGVTEKSGARIPD